MALGIVVLIILVAVIATMQASGESTGGSSTGGSILGSLESAFGGNLNAQQIAGYASNAGFQGSDLVMSVAVALAESSGNPSASGDNGTSTGLWQIHFTVHPEFNGWDLTDPQTNANAAFSVYTKAGNSFSPWTTYNNGMASNNLSIAEAGVTAMQGTATG
jgi:hypothetical protein